MATKVNRSIDEVLIEAETKVKATRKEEYKEVDFNAV